jgi:hypothetical protein
MTYIYGEFYLHMIDDIVKGGVIPPFDGNATICVAKLLVIAWFFA